MIEVTGLTRTFRTPSGPVRAVDRLDLVVPEGAFTTLLGPSGCGKSTTLRMIAGLERPDAGTVRIGGVMVASDDGTEVPAHRRGVGMVFQSYAVWPHLDVAGNVAYPLRAQGVGRREAARRVEEVLTLVGLAGLGQRRTTELSGGQQQRVALARALVARPSVLLLDEPLSNLDARLREEVRGQILDLRDALGITVLLVTHDREEALAMSDEVVVMEAGRAVAAGPPEELHDRPATAAVARLLGAPNVLSGSWLAPAGAGAWTVRTCAGDVVVAAEGLDPAADGTCAVVARRDAVVVGHEGAGGGAVGVDALVVRREFRGEAADLVLDVGGMRLRAAVDPARPAPPPGAAVRVRLDPAGCRAARP